MDVKLFVLMSFITIASAWFGYMLGFKEAQRKYGKV